MTIIAKLIIDDVCGPSNQEQVQYVIEMLSEVFGKEETQEHPRVKLIFMEVKERYEKESYKDN